MEYVGDPWYESVRIKVPVGVLEQQAITTFLEIYPGLEAPFDQHADPVHVTGSAIVASDRGIILLHHKRLHIWVQPGGHLDPGETPPVAALREAIEETGLDLKLASQRLVHVDVHPGGRGHTHLDLRYLIVPQPGSELTPRPPAEESQRVEWFALPDAVRRADDPALQEFIGSIVEHGLDELIAGGDQR